MAIDCPALITRDQCNALHPTRYKAGRTGYVGAPTPKAIVLHPLKGISCEQYDSLLTAPLPKFQCLVEPDCTFTASANPKSVHFMVSATGAIQYAELGVTTFGIDYFLNPTWPGLTALMPITDVNGPFIHIAICGDCANALVPLLCCIGVALGVSLPIIAGSDLQADRPELQINPSIQVQVDACVASGGFEPPPDVFDLEDRVDELEKCCLKNSGDIIVLKQDLTLLTQRVAVVENDITTIKAQIVTINDTISVIPALVAQVTTLINQVADILKRCCPVKLDAECFNYQLTAGSEMLITPNQCVWLNLPTKIVDREEPNCTTGCKGPIVKPGPLWSANLCDCTWSLKATVRFHLAQWCPGKKASLYLVACGAKYLLAEQVIAMEGSQVVTLTGSFLLPTPPCCDDVHLLVCSSDDKITTAKVVEFASFEGCCA